MPLYAAYGSNMDPSQMLRRCPHSPEAGTGWIHGWRLTFGGEELGWEGALPTILPADDHDVFVALYDVSAKDQRLLDAWEGADNDLYMTMRMRVATLTGDELAWAYVLNAFEGGLPSARTIGLISDAAEVAGAPDDYVAALRARECRSVGD